MGEPANSVTEKHSPKYSRNGFIFQTRVDDLSFRRPALPLLHSLQRWAE